jgi:hypothetical protein
MDLKEYQNRDLKTEEKLQTARHTNYKQYREITAVHQMQVGREKIPGYESAFMRGPIYERHVVFSVGPHVYKLKLHSFGRNSHMERAYERMLGSITKAH